MPGGMRITLATGGGLLLILAFPSYDLYPLAWIALAPVLLAIDGIRPNAAFRLGFLAGFLHFAGTVYWVTNSIHNYGHVPLPASIAVMLLLVAYLALYWGGFAFLINRISQGTTPLKAAAAPFLWTSLELLRSWLFTGFPWDLLGYSQYRCLPVIQIADITGVYGVSFLLVLVNSLISLFLARWFKREKILSGATGAFAVATLGIVAATYIYGYQNISRIDAEPATKTLHIALAQGNIEQDVKWNERYQQQTVDIYRKLTDTAVGRRLTETAVRQKADLVIWPETAAPFLFNRDLFYRNQVLAIAKDNNTAILFGSPEVEYQPGGEPLLYNSVYLVDPQGREAGKYQKRHLVPFGEYVPLHSILFFIDKMVSGIGEFGRGKEPTLLKINGVPFGTVICYEIIFPGEVRELVQRGARFMTTVTNDAWFGNSSAPYQHFAMAVFRAVENRVPLARSANTGISGFVDAAGRTGPTSAVFTEAVLDSTIKIAENKTFYTSRGDIFAYISVLAALGFLLGVVKK